MKNLLQSQDLSPGRLILLWAVGSEQLPVAAGVGVSEIRVQSHIPSAGYPGFRFPKIKGSL